jgi:hypothetical protein
MPTRHASARCIWTPITSPSSGVLTEAREHLELLNGDPPETNPKGRLQEILQAISPFSPTYPIVDQSGRSK